MCWLARCWFVYSSSSGNAARAYILVNILPSPTISCYPLVIDYAQVPDDKILHIGEPAQSRSSGDVSSTSTVHARGSIPVGEVEASKPSTGNLSVGGGEEVHDAGGASSVTPPLNVKVQDMNFRCV